MVLEFFTYFRYKYLVSECVPQWLLSRVPLLFKTFQGFLSHLGINVKSLSQPTRSMRNDLLYQVHLISCCFSPYSLYSHCQHAMPAPASGPLHCFTHCLECSSPNSLQAYSLIPSSSLLKCHLFTHLNSFPLLPTQHPSPALFSSWHRQCQQSNLCCCISPSTKMYAPRGQEALFCLLQRTSLMSWLWNIIF